MVKVVSILYWSRPGTSYIGSKYANNASDVNKCNVQLATRSLTLRWPCSPVTWSTLPMSGFGGQGMIALHIPKVYIAGMYSTRVAGVPHNSSESPEDSTAGQRGPLQKHGQDMRLRP